MSLVNTIIRNLVNKHLKMRLVTIRDTLGVPQKPATQSCPTMLMERIDGEELQNPVGEFFPDGF
jgi:hypothetical protein